MPRDPLVLIEDMVAALERIESYTRGFQSASLDDPRTLDAVIRNLEILGEAAKGVPDSLRDRMPSVPWRKLSGFRDVLAHQYFGVEIDVIADVVANRLLDILPVLREHLQAEG